MFNFDRIDRQMKNFHGMVDRLGIDPVDLATDCLGYRLTSALRRCTACDATEACGAWLAQAERPETPRPSAQRRCLRACPSQAGRAGQRLTHDPARMTWPEGHLVSPYTQLVTPYFS